MPARMGELIGDVGQIYVSNEQRHSAAAYVADRYPDKQQTAMFLVALGLASHGEDERFRSTKDAGGESWFTPNPKRRAKTLKLAPDQLNAEAASAEDPV